MGKYLSTRSAFPKVLIFFSVESDHLGSWSIVWPFIIIILYSNTYTNVIFTYMIYLKRRTVWLA